jgi:hypothetical protein
MTNRQEVRVRTGALTVGTRHRWAKGVELEHQLPRRGTALDGPARGGLVEVVGAWRDPNEVKCHEASALGRLAAGSESPISVGNAGVRATGRHEVCWDLPSEICRAPRER